MPTCEICTEEFVVGGDDLTSERFCSRPCLARNAAQNGPYDPEAFKPLLDHLINEKGLTSKAAANHPDVDASYTTVRNWVCEWGWDHKTEINTLAWDLQKLNPEDVGLSPSERPAGDDSWQALQDQSRKHGGESA